MTNKTLSTAYQKQHRGSEAAYQAYFSGMDTSVQQKIALTTAHFPTHGRIADMGSGSGRGTFDLACLYDALELVGVDINPISVAFSEQHFQRPNLRYVVGDIAEKVFPEASLDGILNSSVFHHITSFNEFDIGRIFTTLDHQVAQLKVGGVIIVRDFLIPDGPETVLLDLPTHNGTATGTVSELSTAALFEVFARQFRSSVNRYGEVPFTRLNSPFPGFQRFQVNLRAATEFILRKDYRDHWETEILEEYTYFTQSRFEQAFCERGLRIVSSMPIWNPWIVRHRYEGKLVISDLNERLLPFPPTNYLIVGEKVESGAGIELQETACQVVEQPQFLKVHAYRHQTNHRIYELAERPNQTLDLLPWFEHQGRILVLAKKDFPRPITNACRDHPNLTGSHLSGYITEPISAIVGAYEDFDLATQMVLEQRAGIRPDQIAEFGPTLTYYTSPGGINERVTARLVAIQPQVGEPFKTPNYTQFSDAGQVRELDACQVLRACHVSGMFDARLEVNIYRLLHWLGQSVGPWIGAPIALALQETTRLTASQTLFESPPGQAFEYIEEFTPAQFLAWHQSEFTERTVTGETLSNVVFEYITARNYSRNTVVALPVAKTPAGIFIGIEHRDLPAVQYFSKASRLAVACGWRLPFEVAQRGALPGFLKQKMLQELGIRTEQCWELGGCYFPTPGVTPEIVHPYLVEVKAGDLADSRLHLIEIKEFVAKLEQFHDAHLLIAGLRTAHALGNPA